jgi:hypothetical protein
VRWPVFGAGAVVLNVGALSLFASKAAGQLHVFGSDGDPPGVHGAHVGVFHQANEISLGSLLKSENGRALKAKILADAGGNFAHKALEGQFSDQQISALLVSPDVAEGHRARAVSMRPFSGSRNSGAGGLFDQLSSRRLPSSRRLSRGLFCASHVDVGLCFWWRS